MKIRWALNIEEKLLGELKEIHQIAREEKPKLNDNKSFNAYLVSILRIHTLKVHQERNK